MPDDPPRKRGAYRSQKTRAAAPPPLRIEERDLAILAAIAEHRFLTRELLLLLFPPDVARTPTKAITAALAKRGRTPNLTGAHVGSNLERRLRLFFHHGFVERIPRGLGQPYAYALATAGRTLLRKLGSLNRPLTAIGASERLFYVEHALMVARFRIALALAVRERSSLELVDSQRESQALRHAWSERGERLNVNPDGFFLVAEGAGSAGRNARACFLECDRDTMVAPDVLKKFESYARFEASGKLAEIFRVPSARIVTVASTRERAAALLTLTAKTESKVLDAYRDRFLFTAEEAYRERPVNVLAQIWRAADKPDERASIVPSPLPIS